MLEAESEIMMTRNPTQQAPGIKDKATNTPAVIAWLLTNYALREGAPSLPKAQVYQEYVAYCGEAGLEPTTPPAFGKILRVAFPSIECRRKGPRGEAKHHYKHFCKKSDLALLALPSSSTSSSAASVNGHISPSPIPTSKFDVSSGTTHRHITSSPASSSASVRLPSLRTTSPFQPIMDDVSHQLYPHRYHGDYHDGQLVDDVSSGVAAAKKRTLDSHGSDPHADLRELLKKKIKSESRGADADPSAQRMRGGHMQQQHHGGPDQDNEAELGSSQDQHHKRRRLSQEISNNSNGVEYENNSNSNDDDDEEGAVAEYIRQFKSSTESIDRRKSPSPPPPLQRPSSGSLSGETATRLDPSPPALPSFNSLAIPLRLPPLPQQPHMTHTMLAPPSGASAVHSRLPSPLDFSSLRSPSPSPAPSPYGHTRSHTATPPPAQFFAPPAPSSSSSSGSAGNPPSAPSSSQTALLLSHLQEKEQEVEKLTNELKFLHSRLASTTPIPLPSPSPSPSSSLFPSPHSYSPSPMHHPPSPFAPHAYMRSSPAPYMAGGHSSSPSPSPSPLHHLHHSFTPLSPPPGASSSHSASPLSHHHPHARQYFAPILTLEEQQQQQQQQLHHQRDSTTPTLMQTTTVTIKRERSSKGRESATRDLMASPGPERSSSTSPTHRNRSASPLDADEFSSTSPSSPTSFSSKVMKKEAIPVVVHWIKKNYELSADSSSDLPKEQVYRHYREFCEETGVQQTNCATFGKILRSVFPNLKTRRLGSRGNTKHHYHGIRRRKSPLSTESGAQGGTTSPPPNLNALAVLASISVTGGGSPMPSPPGIPPSSSGSPRQQPHAYEDDVDDDDEDNDNDNEDDMDEEDVEGANGNGNRNDQPLLQSPVPIRPHAKAVGESEEMVNEDDDDDDDEQQQQQQVASYGWVAGGSGGDFALSSRRCTVEACENRAAAQRTICEKHKKQQQRARLRNSLDAKISSAATIFGATPSSSSSSSSSSLSSSLSSSSSILPPLSALSLSPASDVPPPL